MNIKFKALYTYTCSKKADSYGRLYSFVLAIASATSIGTWTLWDNAPSVWGIFIAVSQVLHVAKPYLPFIKNDKSYLEMSYEFESLYLKLEKLWYSLENEYVSQEEAEAQFYQFREKELQIEKSHKDTRCPEFSGWIKSITNKTNEYINMTFIEDYSDEQ